MTYPGLRDWEWMIRVASEPIRDVDEGRRPDHDDVERDIWENSRSGRNPAAEQWLNDSVDYHRPSDSTNPTDWYADAGELPYDQSSLQHHETNRTIDDDHNEFEHALSRGLDTDLPDTSPFSLAGPTAQEYEPTSPERLASDEGWLLGPGKQFNFPGGRDAAEAVHNGMHQRGFDLQNANTDEHPIPAYVHRNTGARIQPNEDGDWQMNAPGMGITQHAGPSSAAALHQQTMDERDAAEARRWTSHSDSQRPARSRGTGEGTRRQETPAYIPKTRAQALPWRELFSQAVHGNQGEGREFERASVKSVHNPYRGDTGRLYGVHQEQWNKDFTNDAAGRGKVSQAIYHYATPIAWKYHEVQPNGTYDEGTWRQPATSFGSGGFFSTGRVQGLMSGAFHGTNHEYLRDPLVSYNLHKKMGEDGLQRGDDQSYSAVDSFGNSHHIAPSQSGQTAVHTVTSPGGESTWTKRVPAHEAGDNFYALNNDAAGLPQTQDPVAFLKSKKYKGSGAAAPTPARRREVPLRLQPELPFRSFSVASWAEFLRD